MSLKTAIYMRVSTASCRRRWTTLDFPGIHRPMGVCDRGISESSHRDTPMVDRTLNKLTAAQVKAASFTPRIYVSHRTLFLSPPPLHI